MNEISNQPTVQLSEKLCCNWGIMLVMVTMATPVSSHVKDKTIIFTASGKDMIFSERRTSAISLVSMQ